MKIKVAHHIFASRKGYQTQFRSPDVTESENAELESFSFGQTNDASYMASLKKHPAFTVRKLRSGRWAITRVFKGADDDYGRATLRFHTVLVSQKEWARRLDFDVLPFLEHPILWKDTDSTEISVERDDSPLPQDITEKVLSLLNQVTASSSPVIVDESVCSLQTIRWVHRRLLDEEKDGFSYGYRVLSDAMDASLLCLARQALRTATSSMGRYDPVRVSEPSPFKAPDYENMNMAYEKPAGSNKLAILIIITVCVLGIGGAIFALVSFSNAQKKNTISGIIKRANELLENNYSFIADPNELAHAEKEAERIRDEIDRLKFPDPEIGPISKNLEKWKSEKNQARRLFDEVQKLINRLGTQLQKEWYAYPNANEIAKIIKTTNDFKGVYEELLNESSSLKFFKNDDNNDLSEEVQRSLKTIDWWENKIENLVIAEPNAVEEIQLILNKTDPSQYISADPSQLDFSSPNLPAWTNPQFFSDLAQEDIWVLQSIAKERIPTLLRNRSLLNAGASPIESHKARAREYKAKLESFRDSVNQNIRTMRTLTQKAKRFMVIEAGLNPKVNLEEKKKSIQNAAQQYKRITTNSNPEEVWANHLRWFILHFYEVNLKPNILSNRGSPPATQITPGYEKLYEEMQKLKEQGNNKSRR